jgi:hypothetical protein
MSLAARLPDLLVAPPTSAAEAGRRPADSGLRLFLANFGGQLLCQPHIHSFG